MKRREARPPALFIRPMEGKTFTEVLDEIRYKIRPVDREAITFHMKNGTGKILIELDLKTTRGYLKGRLKSTLCSLSEILAH